MLVCFVKVNVVKFDDNVLLCMGRLRSEFKEIVSDFNFDTDGNLTRAKIGTVQNVGAEDRTEQKYVQQTLESQREALSGVSMDEEAINLMRQQRAFQAASRVIAAVDEMLKTVLQLA